MAITNKLATALIEGALNDGGATFDLTDNKGRYVVGGIGTFTVPAETARGSHDNMARQLAPYGQNADTIGSWLATETGIIYVDYGTRHGHQGIAMARARDRGELAIWDSLKAEEIRLGSGLQLV